MMDIPCLEILSGCSHFVNRAMQASFVKCRQNTLHIIGQKCYPSLDGMAMLIGDGNIPSWLSGEYLSSSGMIV